MLVRIMRPEEVTLPTRFLTTIAHLIATLTIIFEASDTARQAPYKGWSYERRHTALLVLAWLAIGCMIWEFVGLLAGISVFFHKLNAVYSILHFVGTILVALFMGKHWSTGTYIWLAVFFNYVPAAIEVIVVAIVLKRQLRKYK